MNDSAKPWYASQTMWMGVGQIFAGIGMLAVALLFQHGDLAAPGGLMIATGIGTITGRAKATQTIAAGVLPKQAQK